MDRLTEGRGDTIIIPRGPNKGVWCRTQAAYETIAAAAVRAPALGARHLDRMPVLGTYAGTVVAVASPEKWRELQAEVDAAYDGGREG